jgi:hypothetical protein
MGKLRDQMEQDLKLGGYSSTTRGIYLLYAREFARYHMRSPAEMGEDEIRAYPVHERFTVGWIDHLGMKTPVADICWVPRIDPS